MLRFLVISPLVTVAILCALFSIIVTVIGGFLLAFGEYFQILGQALNKIAYQRKP